MIHNKRQIFSAIPALCLLLMARTVHGTPGGRSQAQLRNRAPAGQPVGGYWRPVGSTVTNGQEQDAGSVDALSIDPHNSKVLYAGTMGGGVWKSTNRGVSWSPTTDFMGTPGIGSLAVVPTNPSTVYALTGSLDYNSVGLLASSNGARSWQLVGQDLAGLGRGYRIVVDPGNRSILYAAMGSTMFSFFGSVGLIPHGSVLVTPSGARLRPGGLFRSSDGGASWQRVLPLNQTLPDIGVYATDVAAARLGSHTVIYAAIACTLTSGCAKFGGIFKSTDHGVHWSRMSGFDRVRRASAPASRIALATLPQDGRILYAFAARSNGHMGGIYRSRDGGKTWSGLHRFQDYGYPTYTNALYLVIDPRHPNTIFAGGGLPYASFDGGNTWHTTTQSVHVDNHTTVIAPDGTLYLGNDSGVLRTGVGARGWAKANGGLDAVEVYTVANSWPRQPFALYLGMQDDGLNRYAGKGRWQLVLGGDTAVAVVDPSDPNTAYAAAPHGPFSTVHNRLNPYRLAAAPMHLPPEEVTPGLLAVDPQHRGHLLTAGRRVWESNDWAAHWHPAGHAQRLTSGRVTALALVQGSGATLYGGTSDGRILSTSNDGGSWTVGTGIAGKEGSVRTMVINPRNPHVAWALLAHLYRTVDGGATWHRMGSTVRDTSFSPISSDIPLATLVVDNSGRTLYEARGQYVYASTDGGRSWVWLGHGLPRVWVSGLALRYHKLYAATYGRGVWVLRVP